MAYFELKFERDYSYECMCCCSFELIRSGIATIIESKEKDDEVKKVVFSYLGRHWDVYPPHLICKVRHQPS